MVYACGVDERTNQKARVTNNTGKLHLICMESLLKHHKRDLFREEKNPKCDN